MKMFMVKMVHVMLQIQSLNPRDYHNQGREPREQTYPSVSRWDRWHTVMDIHVHLFFVLKLSSNFHCCAFDANLTLSLLCQSQRH